MATPHHGYKHLLITGKPGIGKTTIVKKVFNILHGKGVSVTGFYTEEVRQGNTRIGFDVVTLDGKRDILARVDRAQKAPKVGKYSVALNSLERLVLPILMNYVQGSNNILIIDEIGKMEMMSDSFCREIRNVFSGTQTILATVPLGGNNLVRQLQSLPSAQTYDVQFSNRDTLPEHLAEILSATHS